MKQRSAHFVCFLAILAGLCGSGQADDLDRGGSAQRPLRVLILPVDGGTAEGTLADYKPSFDAVTRFTGLQFDVKVGQTYAAVIEAISVGVIDVAQFAIGSYFEAARRGRIEPLAIQVIEGSAMYYAGVFVADASPVRALGDVRGQPMAFGDLSSTSSFIYPAAMLLEAGIDVRRDLGRVIVAGSHGAALQALAAGRVAVAGASLISFERALNEGLVRPGQLRIIARSAPIPNPFLTMRADLSPAMKARLRAAFATLHTHAAQAHLRLRGYGGKELDRWETDFGEMLTDETAAIVGRVDAEFKSAVAAKAAAR